MKPPSIVIDHFLSTKWSKKLFTINHYELQNGKCIVTQELSAYDATLGYEKNHKGDLQTDNKRNGHSTKNLKSQYGEFQIDVPRDRNGEFEPKLIPKYQRDISGIEEKVISLYARGMSTRDIHDQLQDLYGMVQNNHSSSAINGTGKLPSHTNIRGKEAYK